MPDLPGLLQKFGLAARNMTSWSWLGPPSLDPLRQATCNQKMETFLEIIGRVKKEGLWHQIKSYHTESVNSWKISQSNKRFLLDSKPQRGLSLLRAVLEKVDCDRHDNSSGDTKLRSERQWARLLAWCSPRKNHHMLSARALYQGPFGWHISKNNFKECNIVFH